MWDQILANRPAMLKEMADAEAARAAYPRVWELGDVIICKSPLAGQIDDEGEPYLSAFTLMLAKRHPNDKDLFCAVVCDDNDMDWAKCQMDVDVPEDNYAGINRVYPHLLLWIHASDMQFNQRMGKLSLETVSKTQVELDNLHQNLLREDEVYEDPDYEESVLYEYRIITQLYQEQLHTGS